ncbi:glycine rich nucleic binding domain [Halocaridina rubra]|uniref:Glycine rich nucleic binding domain n=1 Tax=Halocaridina rubra TaxID=373956 RepID=A0AAN8XBN7_HALRR
MYLLVTNIPENFRTPDLRNFFSKAIEEEIFRCFHFRHRPHKNFTKLFEEWQTKKLSTNGDKLRDQVEKDINCHICDSCGLRKESFTEEAKHSDCTDSVDISAQQIGVSDEIRESQQTDEYHNGKLCMCHKISDECSRTDEKQVKTSKKDPHWLSSGLSGLASLIEEKKQNTNKLKYKSFTERENAFTPTSEAMHAPEKQRQISVKENTNSECLKSANGACCIINVEEELVGRLRALYHLKYWVNMAGATQSKQCFILDLDLNSESLDINNAERDYLSRGSTSELQTGLMDIRNMIEFRPPSVMPQGNVGTPTIHFQNLIRSCQLPGSIIAKLGLQFARRRAKKRFGEVPFDYGTVIYSGDLDNQEKSIAFTASGHLIPASIDVAHTRKKPKEKLKKKGPKLDLENEAEDGAEVEEWERYETFHNDVTSQDRTKERLYEKEIELVWEKGGPGLVFYTDAQYWREQDGDFDEQTADEWDVDMSVYYEKGSGDKDAIDSVSMSQSNKLRSGALSQSVFEGTSKKKKNGMEAIHRRKIGPAAPPKIGHFEAHTRGFGRRFMESQGWKDGVGLGKKGEGMPYALDNDGQHPYDRKGFG